MARIDIISINKPQTLVRIGKYDQSLEEAVKSFHEKLEPLKSILGNTFQYGIFNQDKPYLLMVSQQKDKILNPSTKHNTILTLTSYSDTINQKIADEFEKETGVILNLPVTDWLNKNFQGLNLSFRVFENHPKATMDFLRR